MEARQLPSVFSMALASSSNGVAINESLGIPLPPPPSYQGQGGGGDYGPSPANSLHASSVGTGEPVKRKRGRPRKYGLNSRAALAVLPVSVTTAASQTTGVFSPATNASATAAAEAVKKARYRPPGSSKKQQMGALGGSSRAGFMPHVITVDTGEDVSSKVMAFSQQSTSAICILSAVGAISNVTLHQAAISGGSATYEGLFEILSLSGSFLLPKNGGQSNRAGGLSILLASSDGHVLGGGVAGLLTAASPVQVIVGSFTAEGKKESQLANPLQPKRPSIPQ